VGHVAQHDGELTVHIALGLHEDESVGGPGDQHAPSHHHLPSGDRLPAAVGAAAAAAIPTNRPSASIVTFCLMGRDPVGGWVNVEASITSTRARGQVRPGGESVASCDARGCRRGSCPRGARSATAGAVMACRCRRRAPRTRGCPPRGSGNGGSGAIRCWHRGDSHHRVSSHHCAATSLAVTWTNR
jgi:hypothetical protein